MKTTGRINRITFRVFALVLVLVTALNTTGCGLIPGSKMPFNGDITFHEITATIPDSYIRDSTQSNSDLWIFEQGNYSKYIIISRSDVQGDVEAELDNYVEYMKEQGAESQRDSFLSCGAVKSTYTKDGKYCQEMLFEYNGSFYGVALRGGTEEEFKSLLDTVGAAGAATGTDDSV